MKIVWIYLKNAENCNIIYVSETKKAFEEELFIYFNNEFFKYIFYIKLKLFKNNLKNKLI